MARVRRGIRTGKPTDVRLAGYDGTYLNCRNLGHVWGTVGFFELAGVVRRRLTCQRCDTDRTDRWERNGFRRSSSYDYVDGYRLEGDAPKPVEVRLELMRRATIYRSEDEMLAAITGAV
jgi:hypothetical protein